MVKEIETIDNFITAIGNETTGLIIIDFFADWCGPCKVIVPKILQLEEKYPNVNFYKLNVDNTLFKEILAACVISALPTFCFFKGGKYIAKMIGTDIINLETTLTQYLSESHDINQFETNEIM